MRWMMRIHHEGTRLFELNPNHHHSNSSDHLVAPEETLSDSACSRNGIP
jgi:hypothetical protein